MGRPRLGAHLFDLCISTATGVSLFGIFWHFLLFLHSDNETEKHGASEQAKLDEFFLEIPTTQRERRHGDRKQTTEWHSSFQKRINSRKRDAMIVYISFSRDPETRKPCVAPGWPDSGGYNEMGTNPPENISANNTAFASGEFWFGTTDGYTPQPASFFFG